MQTLKLAWLVSFCLCMLSGCGFFEILAEPHGGTTLPDGSPNPADINNWDFSACFEDFDSFDTCWTFALENSDMFVGGENSVYNHLGGLSLLPFRVYDVTE